MVWLFPVHILSVLGCEWGVHLQADNSQSSASIQRVLSSTPQKWVSSWKGVWWWRWLTYLSLLFSHFFKKWSGMFWSNILCFQLIFQNLSLLWQVTSIQVKHHLLYEVACIFHALRVVEVQAMNQTEQKTEVKWVCTKNSRLKMAL